MITGSSLSRVASMPASSSGSAPALRPDGNAVAPSEAGRAASARVRRRGLAPAHLGSGLLTLSLCASVVLATHEAPADDAAAFVEANARRRARDLPLRATGRVIRATIGTEQEAAIQALAERHRAGGCTSEQFSEQLLALLPVREVRDISLWIESETQFAIEERRDAVRDTQSAVIVARLRAGADPSAKVVLPSEVIRTLSSGNDAWEVSARGVASLSPIPTRRQELVFVDCALADWSPMLLPAAQVEGQRTTVAFDSVTNGIDLVIASGSSEGNGDDSLRHRFENLEFPRCSEMRSDWMRADYLAVARDGTHVPLATLWRERIGSTSEWRLEARVFSTIELGVGAQRPSWRLPSLRVEVVSNAATQSRTVREVLPSWLEGVLIEDWFSVASQQIAAHWGSSDLESDLDGDGVVGAGDFVWVAEWGAGGS